MRKDHDGMMPPVAGNSNSSLGAEGVGEWGLRITAGAYSSTAIADTSITIVKIMITEKTVTVSAKNKG